MLHTPPVENRSQKRRGWLVIAAAFLICGGRLFAFVNRYSANVLFWDEWDYLSGLFLGETQWRLFTWQHGPHRMGLGMLVIQAVFGLSHWDSRALSFVNAGTYLAAALLALWLKKRILGPLTAFDAIIPLLFLTLSHWETWVGVTNPAHGPLPLLLVVAFALSLTASNAWLAAGLALLTEGLAIYTGFALFVGVISPVVFAVALLRPGQRAAKAAGLIGSLLLFASFFHDYRFLPAVDCFVFPIPHPERYGEYAGLLLSHPFGVFHFAGWSRVPIVALLLVELALGFLAAVQLFRTESSLWRSTFILSGFSLLFAFNAAVGRICTGMDSAASSRYVPYAIPALLALYLALHELPWPPLRTAALAGFLAVCVAKELHQQKERDFLRHYAGLKANWRECYLREHRIDACARVAAIYPAPAATHLQEKLDFLEQRGLNLFKK